MAYYSTHRRIAEALQREVSCYFRSLGQHTEDDIDRNIRRYRFVNNNVDDTSGGIGGGGGNGNSNSIAGVDITNDYGGYSDADTHHAIVNSMMQTADVQRPDSLSEFGKTIDKVTQYIHNEYFKSIVVGFFKYVLVAFGVLIFVSAVPNLAALLREQAWGSSAFVFILFVNYLFSQAKERLSSSGRDPERMERILKMLRDIGEWTRDNVPGHPVERVYVASCSNWITRHLLALFIQMSQISRSDSQEDRISMVRMITEFEFVGRQMQNMLDRCYHSLGEAKAVVRPPPSLDDTYFKGLAELEERATLPDSISEVTMHVTVGIRLYMYFILTLQMYGEMGGLMIIVFPFIMSIFDGLFSIISYVDHPFDSSTAGRDKIVFVNKCRYTYWYVLACSKDDARTNVPDKIEMLM